MRFPSAASLAKELLYRASQRLGTANPLDDVGDVLDESLAFPPGEPSSREARPLQPSFSETSPENLSFLVTRSGPRTTAADRIESSTQALYKVAGSRFGRDAVRWLDSRLEAVRGNGHHRTASWGASFGSGFDRNGVAEASVHYEFGPLLMDSLPAPLFRMARLALETLPGLRPALSTVRCGRSSGSQQITFAIERALALADLRPLMDQLGLGHRHASLMSACAFVLGARFTLPPDTATLTLRPTRTGAEVRLDVDLDALPDPPAQLMALMRLQMTERPRGLQALDRWMMALTPDGYPGPGTVSVLSVWVRPDLPARLALYLRPAALEGGMSPGAQPAVSPAGVASGVYDEDEWSSSAWA